MKFLSGFAAAMLLSTAVLADDTSKDAKIDAYNKDIIHVANCQAIAVNLMRMNIIAAAGLLAAPPADAAQATREQYAAAYLKAADRTSKLVILGDSLMNEVEQKRASDLGLDPAKIKKTKDAMLELLDEKLYLGMSKLAMQPKVMPDFYKDLAGTADECNKWMTDAISE
jgi:hypothetical protein